MKRNTPTNEKAGAPCQSEPANDHAGKCTGCTCAAQGSIRLDDQSIHALYFGIMAAVFEAMNLREQERTGKEYMNINDSFDSAMEVADLMIEEIRERRATCGRTTGGRCSDLHNLWGSCGAAKGRAR